MVLSLLLHGVLIIFLLWLFNRFILKRTLEPWSAKDIKEELTRFINYDEFKENANKTIINRWDYLEVGDNLDTDLQNIQRRVMLLQECVKRNNPELLDKYDILTTAVVNDEGITQELNFYAVDKNREVDISNLPGNYFYSSYRDKEGMWTRVWNKRADILKDIPEPRYKELKEICNDILTDTELLLDSLQIKSSFKFQGKRIYVFDLVTV